MFKVIIEAISGATPKYFLSDYESGLISAVKQVLPSTTHLGCWYHFKSALIKNISSKGLNKVYAQAGFAHEVKRIAALAFLTSQEMIESAWMRLIEKASPELEPFMVYFEKQWIGQIQLGKRKSRIPISMWTFTEQVKQGLPLTNNFCEGFHNKLNFLLSKNANSLYQLMEALILAQTSTDDLIDKAFAGIVAKTNSKSATFTSRITDLVSNADLSSDVAIDDYLNKVAILMLN